jgi:hypothetical protein
MSAVSFADYRFKAFWREVTATGVLIADRGGEDDVLYMAARTVIVRTKPACLTFKRLARMDFALAASVWKGATFAASVNDEDADAHFVEHPDALPSVIFKRALDSLAGTLVATGYAADYGYGLMDIFGPYPLEESDWEPVLIRRDLLRIFQWPNSVERLVFHATGEHGAVIISDPAGACGLVMQMHIEDEDDMRTTRLIVESELSA